MISDPVYRWEAAFPVALAREIQNLAAGLAGLGFSSGNIGSVSVCGGVPDASWFDSLGARERAIISCLYTRHESGYVREKYLHQVIEYSAAWVAPFVVQLLGEYALEIVQLIAAKQEFLATAAYTGFFRENPEFAHLVAFRAITYWDCYHRFRYPSLEGYPAFQILSFLGVWPEKGVPKLRR